MVRRNQIAILAAFVALVASFAQAQTGQTSLNATCPGYNPGNNINLACEIATATRTSGKNSTLGPLSATLAAQLSSLPTATAVSGVGVSFVGGVGVFGSSSSESLGTILTQRAETIGKHKFFLSFDYQRFGFGSIDGQRFKSLQTALNPCVDTGCSKFSNQYVLSQNSLSLRVEQYTFIGSFGLTNRMDLSLVVPLSSVHLNAVSTRTQYVVSNGQVIGSTPLSSPIAGQGNTLFLPGSKSGIGDITLNFKYNAFKGEKSGIAMGTEFRMPTGDEFNYLGTGAYGFKPYFIYSRHARLTPNVNIAYQWNGSSALFTDPNGTSQNLPSSFHYSGGADFRVTKRITLVGEFLGQYVINGPRLAFVQNAFVDQNTGTPLTFQSTNASNSAPANQGSVVTQSGSYFIDDASAGFKLNPYRGLLISANCIFKLDDGGLRAKVVPLVGVSYRF